MIEVDVAALIMLAILCIIPGFAAISMFVEFLPGYHKKMKEIDKRLDAISSEMGVEDGKKKIYVIHRHLGGNYYGFMEPENVYVFSNKDEAYSYKRHLEDTDEDFFVKVYEYDVKIGLGEKGDAHHD